jgi:acyl carrier protein
VLAASPFNWRRLLSSSGGAELPAFLQEFADAASADTPRPGAVLRPGAAPPPGTASSTSAGDAGGHMAALAPDARRAALAEAVRSVVAGLVGGAVAPDAPLMASGLDSLGAVELRSSLEARLQLQLPATLVFDFPTQAALVSHLDSLVAAGSAAAGPQSAAAAPATAAPAPGHGPAPAGRAGAGAAAAPGLMVVSATAERAPVGGAPAAAPPAPAPGAGALGDAVRVVPLERWGAELALTEQRPARFGGFVEGAQVRGRLGGGTRVGGARGNCCSSGFGIWFGATKQQGVGFMLL